MKYQVYEKYKDSGLEMIGEIPEHWNIRKLRYFAKIQPSNVDKKSVEDQKTIHLCNYLDVYNHEYIDKNIDFMKATASDSQIINFTLRKGDIIITKDSETPLDIAVPAYVPRSLPGIICGYHLAMIRVQNEISAGEFIFRAFQSESISNQYSSFSNGLTRYGLKVHAIGNALFPLPPLDEQESIINFLKRKTSEIDTIIADKEKIVDLLQEYRQALISEAVTRGLDPNVEMKDSGIGWIGDIPKQWEIIRAYGILDIYQKTINPEKLNVKRVFHYSLPSIYERGDGNYENPEDIKSTKIVLKGNELLVSKLNPHKGIVLITEKKKVPIVSSTEFVPLRAIRCSLKYIYYVYSSHFIREYLCSNVQSATQSRGRVKPKYIRKIKFVFPPIEEQIGIVDYLEKNDDSINETINFIQKEIEELNNFRQTLISEAITGKIDVRNYN